MFIFSTETLDHIAKEYELTKQQTEILFGRIVDKKDYRQIAAELETSENACQKCMGEVYKKFNIVGATRGKERRLIKILDSLNKTERTVSVPPKTNYLTKNHKNYEYFRFILEGEHAIARSLFAFISRILKQLKTKDFTPAKILEQAIYEINSNLDHSNNLKNATSATLRKVCFEQMLKLNDQCYQQEEKLEKFSIPFDHVIKNLKVIRYTLDRLPEQDFQILEYRFDEGLSYEQIVREWYHASEMSDINEKIDELKGKEYKILKDIRLRYHEIIQQGNIQKILDELEGTEAIKSGKLDIKKAIDIKKEINTYSKLSTHITLNCSDLKEIKRILNYSINIPLIDFWINEIDHFIAHERDDLNFTGHKKFEAEQKKELRKAIEVESSFAAQKTELSIADWHIQDFKVYCHYNEVSQAEVTLWNPKLNQEYTSFASGVGSIETLGKALRDCVNGAFQSLGKKPYIHKLYRVDLQNVYKGSDNRMGATILLLYNNNFYYGEETHKDSITAAFQAYVSAIKNIIQRKITSISEVRNIIPDHTIECYGELRFQKTIDLLKIIKPNSQICAVSSGDIINWWKSELGCRFRKINQDLVKRKVSVRRIFIVDNLSEDIKEVFNQQTNDGIEVFYVLKHKLKELEFKWEYSNFLVAKNYFATKMLVNEQGKEQNGFISWKEDCISNELSHFEAILSYAIPWNEPKTISSN